MARTLPSPARKNRSDGPNVRGSPAVACPCGGGAYADCCGRFLEGGAVPGAAVELMRARYSAYALGRFDFVKASWHPASCPGDLEEATGPVPRWLGLDVRAVWSEGEDVAGVEFVARYRIEGRGHRLHERSRFERRAGRWLYCGGEILA